MRRCRVWLMIVLSAAQAHAAVPSSAGREGWIGGFHPRLVQAVHELNDAQRGRSPATYVALRQIWQTWDRADPAQVEAALRDAARNQGLSPAERSYAALLVAYARIRRGDVAGGARRVRELGFVDRWLTLGPYDNEGKSGFERDEDPERSLDTPVSKGRAYMAKDKRLVSWRPVGTSSPYGYLDFGQLMRPTEWTCAFAATFVQDKKQKVPAKTVAAFVGASGAFKLSWNGEQLLADESYRSYDADRLSVALTLRQGVNVLVLKVCGEQTAPVLSVRLANPDGSPNGDLEFSTEALGSLVPTSAQGTPTPTLRVAPGPLRRFEELLAKDPRNTALEEAFARYLWLTGGEGTGEHRARDLAQAVAEQAPTVPRFLLAAALAESANQRVQWLTRALALPSDDPTEGSDVQVQLADVAVQSVHWQDAVLHYQRALRLDPDNVDAISGLVTLIDGLGLTATAVQLIDEAVIKNPTSVLLLNLLSSGLRKSGRETEAREVERRYHAYRFDDRGFLAQELELARVRRSRTAAEHWAERTLSLEPSSAWAQQMRAETQIRFGDRQGALATYRHALETTPGDYPTLQALADLYADLGQEQERVATLKQMLALRPQDKATRDYLDYLAPDKPREDERYALGKEAFLRLRHMPADGYTRRSLVDLKVRTVYENGLSSLFRQIVFQPLTDSAAALSKQYVFQYEATREQVQLRGARVYKSDGRVEEAVETGEAPVNNPELAMYTSQRNVYVQFPRLEAGDVVELLYRLDDTAHRNEFADYFGEVTYFGSSEPVARAQYILRAPTSRPLYVDVKRIPGLKQSERVDGNRRVYSFAANDLPATVPEPSMPPWSEVLGYLHVSTYQSYRELGAWYWGLIRDQLTLDLETQKLAQSITAGLTTEREKVRAVYDWVTSNTRYVALEFGIYGYKPRRAVQTVSRGWGDCKDKAAVIISLLEAVGIEAQMAVVRSQLRGGFDSDVPSLAPFDHAVAYVPTLGLYLDGTAEFTSYTELPEMDAGALALLVDEDQATLTHLPSIDPLRTRRARGTQVWLEPDGQARVDLSFEATGSQAPSWRRRYQAESTRAARIEEDVSRQFPGFALNANRPVIASGLEASSDGVKLEATGRMPHFAREQGKNLRLTPTVSTRLSQAYASLGKRELALALPTLGTVEEVYEIHLPKGFEVAAPIPSDSLKTEFGSFAVSSVYDGDTVTVSSRLTLDVTRVEPTQYAAWKAFCEAADAAFDHPLLLARPPEARAAQSLAPNRP